MKLFLFEIFLLSSLSRSSQENQTRADLEWRSFKTTHRKTYESTEEEAFRKQTFLDNLNKVTKHNELFQQGWVKYDMEVGGKYADLSFDEFKEFRTGFVHSDTIPNNNTIQYKLPQTDEVTNVPKNFDWRNIRGVSKIGPVRDQGKCSCSWIFASLGMIEAQLNILTVSISNLHLSEQQVLDCARSDVLKGCDGKLEKYTVDTHSGFENLHVSNRTLVPLQIIKNNKTFNKMIYLPGGEPMAFIDLLKIKMAGITGYNNYRPYEAEQATCKRRISAENFYMAESALYKENFPAEIMMQLATAFMGPMVVGVSITENFVKYKSGIFNVDPLCTPHLQVNHILLVVGYGVTADGTKFWTLKNSWGTQWGEQGYIRILRNQGFCKVGYYYGIAFTTS